MLRAGRGRKVQVRP